jgi:hypothetical protein
MATRRKTCKVSAVDRRYLSASIKKAVKTFGPSSGTRNDLRGAQELLRADKTIRIGGMSYTRRSLAAFMSSIARDYPQPEFTRIYRRVASMLRSC